MTPALSLAFVDGLPLIYLLAPAGAIAALAMAIVFSRLVLSRPEGDPEMVHIAEAVREGAMAYLKRQYMVVAVVFVLLAVALGGLYALRLQPALSMIGVPLAGILSALCGWFGMRMATHAASRTAWAARRSLNDALTVAFRSGAVMGMVVVGFALLDASFWFFALNTFGPKIGIPADLRVITTIMLGFGMGASTQALFARVGGGIFTKAADVGADLVGKVEAGIPEDDARNPATIADNVGDNVGDVAGMGADLYESYYGAILATMALGAAAAFSLPGAQSGQAAMVAMSLAVAPLVLAGAGILCSIVGVFAVRAKEDATFAQLLVSLHRGVYVASGLIAAAAFLVLYALLGSGDRADVISRLGVNWLGIGLAIVSGLIAGLVIAWGTERCTSYEHEPTRRIAHQAITGPATVIISGIAEGMKSVWIPLLTVVVAVIASFTFAGGADNFLMGLYGIGIAAVGMLATLGITLATDAYGPIADNAGGIAEMSGQPDVVRHRTDMLDSLGNTTAATGKGFAIGSAALTALALFAAYIQVVQSQLVTQAEDFYARSAFAQSASPDLRAKPHAIYKGHEKFAVYLPEGADGRTALVDAGLIDFSLTPGHMLDHLEVGMALEVRVFGEELDPGAHAHDHEHDHDHEHAEGEEHAHRSPLWDRLARARRFELVGEHDHGDHTDHFNIVAFSARNAGIHDILRFYDVTLINPRAVGGLFIGVMLTFLFCAMTMSAVGRAATAMMQECRRQFAQMREALRRSGAPEDQVRDARRWPKRIELDGVMYPDYATCVQISTAGAQKAMVLPSLLAILAPLAVGLVLDVPGVVGMLAGGLTCGFAVAIFMANAGGAWDNAKKLIESYGSISADEFLDDSQKRQAVPADTRDAIDMRATELRRAGRGGEVVYGKGSDEHRAAVVGDTVGDPFKDTSGPSLNILIKLISIVSVVFAGLVVKFGPVIGGLLGLH